MHTLSSVARSTPCAMQGRHPHSATHRESGGVLERVEQLRPGACVQVHAYALHQAPGVGRRQPQRDDEGGIAAGLQWQVVEKMQLHFTAPNGKQAGSAKWHTRKARGRAHHHERRTPCAPTRMPSCQAAQVLPKRTLIWGTMTKPVIKWHTARSVSLKALARLRQGGGRAGQPSRLGGGWEQPWPLGSPGRIQHPQLL